MLFFGGSFDPPHTGHTTLPTLILEALNTPKAPLVYVPAARSPHKATAQTPAAHRVAMLERAVPQDRDATIWTYEIDRARTHPGEPSYWVHTWERARAACPGAELRFLIGADQALAMHRWSMYHAFWRDAIVMLRDEHGTPDHLIDAMRSLDTWSDKDLEHWRSRIVPIPALDASSTRIRASLADPSQRENPIAGLDERVRSYILEHELYRA